MMYWNDGHMSGWGYGFMGVGMALFWGLLIFGIVVLLRYTGGGRGQPPAPDSAERILAERFARGEIDEQEYRQRLDVLRGAAPADTVRPAG